MRWVSAGFIVAALAGCQAPEARQLPLATAPSAQDSSPRRGRRDEGPIPIVPAPRNWITAPTPTPTIRLELGRERQAALPAGWRRRDTLWDDAGLVFAAGRGLWVLEGGESTPRRIWRHYPKRGALLNQMAWSADGSALYLWLSLDEQLCALDARTGAIRNLAKLDAHVWHYELLRHLDPAPEPRAQGLLVDAANERLLLLLDEESNAAVAPWQRRPFRGGSWLAAVDLDGGSLRPLFGKGAELHQVVGWDLATDRSLLYTLAFSAEVTKYTPGRRRHLEERRLDGSVVRAFDEPDGKTESIQLSPDQRRLLIERRYRPGFAIPSGTLDDMSREQVRCLVDNDHGGWVVLDLDTGECVDGPHSGEEARWAPDSDRIIYVDGWAASICSLESGTITPLILGGREDWGLGTWIEPVWSPDGRHLAITARVLDKTLLLDLEAKEYLVIEMNLGEKIWSPTARPFSEAPTVGPTPEALLAAPPDELRKLFNYRLPLEYPLAGYTQWWLRSWLADGWTTYSWWRWRLAPDLRREALARDYLENRYRRGLKAEQVLFDLGLPSWTSDDDDDLENEHIGYTVGRQLEDDAVRELRLLIAIDTSGTAVNSKLR